MSKGTCPLPARDICPRCGGELWEPWSTNPETGGPLLCTVCGGIGASSIDALHDWECLIFESRERPGQHWTRKTARAHRRRTAQ